MLRLRNVILGDIKFQIKYGFYFIYAVFLVLYIGALSMLPEVYQINIGNIMIYSDPAAMGMFFMGAIVLLEKSQKVLNSVAISPVTPIEYMLGKMISIGIVSLIVGGALSIYIGSNNILLTLLGILFASFLFTLFGLFVGSKVNNLNQYVLATVPFEIIGFLPPIAYCLGFVGDSKWLLLHPGYAAMRLIQGSSEDILLVLLSCLVWIVIIFFVTRQSIIRMFQTVGGVKL